ncbi:helix-turn-helix transcriptional regulator [Candidatus Daviesbacteria bacterium]|nr:helix-turn-helix transcriptional regulator [Candidatus Daviesbacteria bacterium]
MVTKRDKKLGKQLHRLRKQRKLTQEQIAEKVRVSAKYIQYLESAKRVPSLKLLYRVADTLQVKVKDLFTF